MLRDHHIQWLIFWCSVPKVDGGSQRFPACFRKVVHGTWAQKYAYSVPRYLSTIKAEAETYLSMVHEG